MKFKYRGVDCTFKQFISTYMAVSFTDEKHSLDLIETLIKKRQLGEAFTEDQIHMVLRDTGYQVQVELEESDKVANGSPA